jgi:hypothetical protein
MPIAAHPGDLVSRHPSLSSGSRTTRLLLGWLDRVS